MKLNDFSAGDARLCEEVAPLLRMTPDDLEAAFHRTPDADRQRLRTLWMVASNALEYRERVLDEPESEHSAARTERAEADVTLAMSDIQQLLAGARSN